MAILNERDLKRREGVLQGLEKNQIPVDQAIERLLEIWPDDPLPYTLKGTELVKAGDTAEAEEWLWKAMERQPRSPDAYLHLTMARSGQDPQDILSRHLVSLVFQKLGAEETIPDDLAEQFGEAL